MALQVASFLPLVKGLVDTGNPSLDLTGAVRAMKGFQLVGANKIVTRSGSAVALTLKDDAGTPADVTSVCGVWQFTDRAVAIAHSTATQKAYLYVLAADLTDWYDGTGGTLQGSTSPEPAAVIWTSITIAPDVFVAEGLGTLYIAHAQGVDSTALNFATQQWDGTYAVALTTVKFSGTGGSAGTDDGYANGVIAYQNHLWAWGYGSGSTVPNAYRPEMVRFSQPSFDPFQSSDSLTIGNRVRSEREHIISGGIAGNALILQGTYITSRITGYGRASWYREIVDESSGITGPKAGVSDDAYWYYWSAQGPMRIGPTGKPEPLYEAVAALVSSVVNPEKIIASRDVPNNLVLFHVDTGSGVRTRAAFHTLRNIWITSSDDCGLAIKATGEVAPIIVSTAAGVAPPSGPPTTPSTDSVGRTTARAVWVAGDATASTEVSVHQQGAGTYPNIVTYPSDVTSATFVNLSPTTAYEWRARHVRAGQYSSYLGPEAGTQFSTTNTLQPPTSLGGVELDPNDLYVTWTNSGESGVSTEIYVADPGGVFTLRQTASPGASSTTVFISGGVGDYQIKIRHVLSGATASIYTGPITVTVS